MALIQVALEVPDDVYVALLNGDLIRRGGVVRDATGQIVGLIPISNARICADDVE